VAPDPWRHGDGLRPCPCWDVLPVSAGRQRLGAVPHPGEAPQQPGPALSGRRPGVQRRLGAKLLTSTDPGFHLPDRRLHPDLPSRSADDRPGGGRPDGVPGPRNGAHAGNDFPATDGWLAYVHNGKTSVDTHYLAPNISEARGWYGLQGTDGLGYENARLRSPLPTAPLSGTWSPEVETLPGRRPELAGHAHAGDDRSGVPRHAAGQREGPARSNRRCPRPHRDRYFEAWARVSHTRRGACARRAGGCVGAAPNRSDSAAVAL
jgi:hypothetical protein